VEFKCLLQSVYWIPKDSVFKGEIVGKGHGI
jgi:hypothetical protein